MPDPHASAVVKVDHFRGVSEAQHVGGQHAMTRGEGDDVALPPKFGGGTVLPAMKQDDRIALPRFEIAGRKTINLNGLALDLHYSPVEHAKLSIWVAISSSWLLIVASVSSPFSPQIWSAELIATPSGVGQALNACPMFRRWLSV